MPTGFTAPIYDGEDITFEQFANSCLRNFGIYLRFEGKYPNLIDTKFQTKYALVITIKRNTKRQKRSTRSILQPLRQRKNLKLSIFLMLMM